jgi:TRAP transporter TAXI family solute receptor
MSRRTLLAGFAAGLAAPASARAQSGSNTVARANTNVLGVISGGLDGTYTRFAADFAAVLDDRDTLRVLPIIGKGSLQNLSDLLYLRGVDIAIVQSDVLAAAAQQRAFPGLEQQVRYVAKLYDEEVHVFARPGVQRLTDLAGKLVSMDNPGSGTAMTSTLLFSHLGITVQPVYDATVDATEKLRRGDIAAMVRVTGKPARFTTPLPEGTHLLPVPLSEALLETYLPAQFTSTDYPALIQPGETVETLSVGAILAVYNHQNPERRERLLRFSQALSLKFEAFLRPPRHPKWRDVNLLASVPGWTRFGHQQPRPQQRPRRPPRTPETAGG